MAPAPSRTTSFASMRSPPASSRPRPPPSASPRTSAWRSAPRPTTWAAWWWCSVPELRVCALYPDLMNIYADRGNLLVLERRCRWRGIDFSLSSSGLGDRLDPDAADLFYIGGGQDRDQRLCALDLAEVKRDALHAVAARDGTVLAVCGGYQLLGHSYQLGQEVLPGVGLVDLETVRADGPRLI